MILEKGKNTNKCVTRTGNKDQGRVDAGGPSRCNLLGSTSLGGFRYV